MKKSERLSVGKLLSDLKGIVGEAYISGDIHERVSYAKDPMPYDLEEKNIPYAVVRPGSTQEISKLMAYLNKKKVPVYVHGSGTSLGGHSRPKKKGVVLSTNRLSWIDINEDYMFMECGGGTVCADLMKALDQKGYLLPMNPGSQLVATIGGFVSNDSIGHMIDVNYGRPSHHLLGLEVVLPTGEIIETGTKSLRRPAGIELTRFFASSEGLFGIITKVRMDLIKKPFMKYVVAYFKEPEFAAYSFMRMYREHIPLPLYGEFLGANTARVGFQSKGLEPPGGCVALATSIGKSQEEADANAEVVRSVFEKEKAFHSRVLEPGDEQQKIWAARESTIHITQDKGNGTTMEVVAAIPHLAEAMTEIHEVSKTMKVFKDTEIYTFGHLGALSLHGVFIIPNEWPDKKKKAAVLEVMRVERRLNLKYEAAGGEWGQMAVRVPFFREKYGEKAYSLVKQMKRVFDPNNILNSGNVEGLD
ncbi:MAG: FAD-binding oxidoreductase [Thermodesulfobacteriota bacterium]